MAYGVTTVVGVPLNILIASACFSDRELLATLLVHRAGIFQFRVVKGFLIFGFSFLFFVLCLTEAVKTNFKKLNFVYFHMKFNL